MSGIPWVRVPEGWIGGEVPWQIPLIRTPNAYGVLRHFEAFAEGLRFSLVTLVRGDRDELTLPRRLSAAGLSLDVHYSDGRTSKPDPVYAQDRSDDGTDVWLVWLGGHGDHAGRELWKEVQDWWLTPLPPPGPLWWTATWPEVGAQGTSIEVDASGVQDAAQHAYQAFDFGNDAESVDTS